MVPGIRLIVVEKIPLKSQIQVFPFASVESIRTPALAPNYSIATKLKNDDLLEASMPPKTRIIANSR